MRSGQRPRMLVVAGPSGAGKSCCFPVSALGVDAFNVDDRAATLQGSYVRIPRELRRAVGQECERFVQEHLDARRSFAVETTLRAEAPLEQARAARARGFATELIFVAAEPFELLYERVRLRAQAAGHALPEPELRAIHEASLGHLSAALQCFERATLYDATAAWTPPRLVATALDGQLQPVGATPRWLTRSLGSPALSR